MTFGGVGITVLTVIIAILIFGALILVHEAGHFVCARIFRVGVREFAVGMGPRIIKHQSKKSGILYSLRLLPIGGFVSMIGEDEESDDENAFCRKPVWKRLIILLAGATMNLIIGIILMTLLVSMSKNLGSTTIYGFDSENASSRLSGLRIGDTITSVAGKSTHISYDLAYTIMHDATEPVTVTVIRDGEKVTIENVVFPTINDSGVVFGSTDFTVVAKAKTFGGVIRHAFYQSKASIRLIWDSLFDLLTGKYGVDQISGPVGVTGAIGEAVQNGSASLIYLTALISLNLGIFNLLPIPALDGGRIVFLLIELVRGKPIKSEYEGYVHFIGIVVLMAFMVFVTYKDIVKLFVK